MLPIAETCFKIYQWLLQPEPLTLIDAATANVTYIGTSSWGTLTSDAKWQILRITSNCTVTTVGGANVISAIGSGTQSITEHAALSGNNIWDNRATSVTYSSL